jgi:hypothetical protein
MGGAAALPGKAPPPPPPPWHAALNVVHYSVAASVLLILVGLVVLRVDERQWRRHHVDESQYTTFLFPCEARFACCCVRCSAARGAPVRLRRRRRQRCVGMQRRRACDGHAAARVRVSWRVRRSVAGR